ncbi:MAG TPA: DNA polymerase III subunit gamma/tau [Polyangiaceae bacterium]
MSYLVLARKYRPQTFDDLVGQEHVARTLANAIDAGRVAHAFLFTGVRGVGKTTSARLLAKCLNCLGPDGNAKGPTPKPCNVCSACKEIAAGMDVDVQEIDGASYNGVDEVRRLQEGLVFRPARDRFKIFIVDEVHMLSNAAWNAFLKTLEEPPPHVKFIFATTEVHKVPVTILSRCQRYDFKLIPTQVIARRLKDVLALEKIAADDTAVAVLAREAAGSMRDAMSLVDQVIAFSGDKIALADVTRVLGVADRKILHDLCAALVDGQADVSLKIVDDVAQQGFDIVHVAKDLLASLRNLVVAKVSGERGRELLDLADEEVKDVMALAGRAEVDDLLRLFNGFSKSFDDIAKSGQARAALEMTLVRLARRPPLIPLDELLVRLGDLERRLGGASSPGPRGGGGGGTRATATHVFTTAVPHDPVLVAPKTRGNLALAPALTPEPTPTPTSATQLKVEEITPPPPPVAVRGAPALDDFRAIVERVRTGDPMLASALEHAVPIETSRTRIALGYAEDDFLGHTVNDEASIAKIARAAQAHFGSVVPVHVDARHRGGKSGSVHAIDSAERRAEIAKARTAVEQHPLVRDVVRIFDAELRDVKLPERE